MNLSPAFVLFLVILLAPAQAPDLSRIQRGNLLDLTRELPPKTQPTSFSGGGGWLEGERRPRSPLKVRLLWLSKLSYEYGDKFVYAVSLTNVSDKPVTIPWRPDHSYQFPVANASVSAYVDLVFESARTPRAFAGGHFLSGSPGQRRSLRTLRPGQTVRIRAPAQVSVARPTEAGRSRIRGSLTLGFKVSAELQIVRKKETGGFLEEQRAVSVNSKTIELRWKAPG